MTAHTIDRPAPGFAGDTDPRRSTLSPRRAAPLAGAAYLITFALAIFANFFVVEALIEPGDATATVAAISGSISLFRWGFVAFLAIFVLDVIIAWALHVVFRRVHADLSLVSAWLRIVYTVLLGVALVFFFQVLQLLSGAGFLESLGADQVGAQVMLALGSFEATWLIGLAAFGIHLVLLGVLVNRSGWVSKILGYLLMVAGAAYVIDTGAHAVLADYDSVATLLLMMVAVPAMISEGWLGLWLLIRARRRLEV